MTSITLLLIAQQAAGVPAEVWVALIAAVSGGLVKPLLDYISKRFDTKRGQAIEEKEAVVLKEQHLREEVTQLKAKLERATVEYTRQLQQHEASSAGKLTELQKAIDHWREKYFSALERFSQAHTAPGHTDLSNPDVLKEVIRHILD